MDNSCCIRPKGTVFGFVASQSWVLSVVMVTADAEEETRYTLKIAMLHDRAAIIETTHNWIKVIGKIRLRDDAFGCLT